MKERRKGPDPPKVDLSFAATKRAVLRATYDNWGTLAPLGAGALAGAWALLLGPSLVATIIAVGGFAVGAASAAANYFLVGDTHASRYIQAMNEALMQRREAQAEELQQALKECGRRLRGIEELIEQGVAQCNQVHERIGKIRDILSQKLDPTELAFGRFAGTTEQVSLAVLDNLQRMAHLLMSLSDDADYISERLGDLKRRGRKPTAEDAQEVGTLEERRRLHEAQLEKVRGILRQNEEALTELDKAAVALAEMKTVRGEAGTDLESARKYLEELVQRTKQFSVQPPDDLAGRV
ncbi:hypothetical protein HYW67_03285 [Candidatus Parcubacteria bacterium]|nr:hypothetical protein [Candidatus Parcubacteria bacterium]